jgi:hypothetical protein
MPTTPPAAMFLSQGVWFLVLAIFRSPTGAWPRVSVFGIAFIFLGTRAHSKRFRTILLQVRLARFTCHGESLLIVIRRGEPAPLWLLHANRSLHFSVDLEPSVRINVPTLRPHILGRSAWFGPYMKGWFGADGTSGALPLCGSFHLTPVSFSGAPNEASQPSALPIRPVHETGWPIWLIACRVALEVKRRFHDC